MDFNFLDLDPGINQIGYYLFITHLGEILNRH